MGLTIEFILDMYYREIKELDKDRLTEEDWSELKAVPIISISRSNGRLPSFLEPFRLLTKMGQEKNTQLSSIGSVLWGFDMLLRVLEIPGNSILSLQSIQMTTAQKRPILQLASTMPGISFESTTS